MLKNRLKMSFCLPEPYNYLKNIFLQQHQYLFLYVIFAVWMLDLSFHIAVKERSEKTKTLNKANNRIWFQDYFPWLKLFLSESFFLEQLTYHYCIPCFRILAFQKCPIHPWTKKGTCLQRPGFFFSSDNVLFPFPPPLLYQVTAHFWDVSRNVHKELQ